MTMKISQRGNVIFLDGVIDENADFSSLLGHPSPLSLNFSGISRINSIGVRSWMKFMIQWGDKPLEYLECPVVISDQLAVMPVLRGVKKRVAQVQSAIISYDCPSCKQQLDCRVSYDQVVPQVKNEVRNPVCKNCGALTQLIHSDQLSIFEPRS